MGQVEVDVAGAADTTVVVVNPGWGDAVQANKAGLLEIADLFVINKADRAGAEETRRDLESMLDLSERRRVAAAGRDAPWRRPARASTTSGRRSATHRAFLAADGRLEASARPACATSSGSSSPQRLRARAEALLDAADRATLEQQVVARRLDPYTAADEILGPLDELTASPAVTGGRPVACRVVGWPSTSPWSASTRRDDGVAVVTLENPKVNALSSEVLRQLRAAAEALTDDPPGAVVVTGGDRVFAAGADISEFGGPGRGPRASASCSSTR